MGELDSNYNSWNREWRSSRKCSRLGIGNRDVRAKLQNLESGIEEFYPSTRLGIGNLGVRAKFEAWKRKWMSSGQVPKVRIGNRRVRGLESGM